MPYYAVAACAALLAKQSKHDALFVTLIPLLPEKLEYAQNTVGVHPSCAWLMHRLMRHILYRYSEIIQERMRDCIASPGNGGIVGPDVWGELINLPDIAEDMDSYLAAAHMAQQEVKPEAEELYLCVAAYALVLGLVEEFSKGRPGISQAEVNAIMAACTRAAEEQEAQQANG